MSFPKSRTAQGLMMLTIGVLAALLTGLLATSGHAQATDGYQVALRWTGRLAFLIFVIPFLASPLRTLYKTEWTAKLVSWRRSAGIAYGGVQAVHLLFIAAMWRASDTNPFDVPTLIVGGLGIALALLMMLTSFDVPAKLLGKQNWKRLHNSGFYVLAFVYFFDFLVKPFEVGLPPAYWPFMAMTAIAFSLRFAAVLKRRKANESGHTRAALNS